MTVASRFSGQDFLMALAVIIIWGLNFVVMKIGLQTLSPWVLGALRFSAASLPLLLFVRPPKLPWRYVLAYGMAQGVGQFGLLFLGLKLGMTASMASVVIQAQAFFTLMMAAAWLGEHTRRWQWLGLAVAFGGLWVIASAHTEGAKQMTLVGFVLTLGSAFMWAVSNLVARAAARAGSYAPFPFIVWSSLAPVLPFFGLALWFDGPASVAHQLQTLSISAVLCVLYLAVLATLLAYSLWTYLLQRHPAGKVSIFSLAVPLVGLAAGTLLLAEEPTFWQWVGTGAVLFGMVINQAGGWWMARRQQRAG